MARNNNPFISGPMPGRQLVERYAQGGLTETERHAVELWAEQDTLLRDALQGLQQPGAPEAFHQLRPPVTGKTGHWRLSMFLGAIVACGAGTLFLLHPKRQALKTHELETPMVNPSAQNPIPAAVESTLQVVHAEIASVPLKNRPDTLPNALERFRLDAGRGKKLERDALERMPPQPVDLDRALTLANPRKAASPQSSRELVFLHDLKLVRPEDLPASKAPRLHSPGVSADREPHSTGPAIGMVGKRPYLAFMDEVTAAIARGDDRSALDGLYLVLDQYPDDVNAQFYAGFCCYRSGLYTRAMHWFHAAAGNVVGSFREEAIWYGAMSTLHADGMASARPALERVVSEGGFYAGQAREVLADQP
jgi:hypothetical protein